MIVTVAPGADAAQVQRALTTKGLWVRPLRESAPGAGPVGTRPRRNSRSQQWNPRREQSILDR